MEYYISKNNDKEGPFTLEELAAQHITPDTLIWTVGYKEWKPAKDIPELADIVFSTPPEPSQHPPMPKTWLVESILVTLFCCLPFGIVGIINAVKVDTLYYGGKYEESQYRSDQAKKWTLWGFFVCLGCGLIYLFFLFCAFLTGFYFF